MGYFNFGSTPSCITLSDRTTAAMKALVQTSGRLPKKESDLLLQEWEFVLQKLEAVVEAGEVRLLGQVSGPDAVWKE